MLVVDLMDEPTHVVREHTPVTEALPVIARSGTGCVPVVDADGSLVGMVSEVDVLRLVVRSRVEGPQRAAGRGSTATVVDAMTRHPATLGPADTVDDVARMLLRVPWRVIPVVEHGKLVGVTTRTAVVLALGQPVMPSET